MTNQTSKKPTLYAYAVRETGNGKAFWNRIGAVWKNSDDSLTIQLDAVPLDGRIVCQTPKHREA
ncbi:MAG: hypothetical protein AAGG48_18250 [Planctomycetota bacterium]